MPSACRESVRLTLGPLLFNWAPEAWRDFYFRIADEAPVDTVHLGEVVCSKRQPFTAPHLPEVVERLTAAGKEVVLSTLALIMTSRELAQLRETAATSNDELLVEANDISAVALLAGRPHVIGPLVNVYNEGTLRYLAKNGATRVCLPVELSRDAIAVLAVEGVVDIEVFAFGRLPLALSARCYHARHHGLTKDSCQFVCQQDADGLDLETLDGTPFLAINGVQTLSHSYINLIDELATLRQLGITSLRLSPHSGDMVVVATAFRDMLDGMRDTAEAQSTIARELDGMPVSNGYFHGRPGAAPTGVNAE